MRLIDADALIKKAYDEAKGMAEPYDDFGTLVEWLVDKAPTIEPEREKGKWEFDAKSRRHRCTECLSVASLDDDGKEVLSDYCGVCGADMRGEQDGD